MFGSTILDVAIGLVLAFLGVSLAASALTEAISSALKIRQKTLLTGIQALLNDPTLTGLAKSLYDHALINPLSGSTVKTAQAAIGPGNVPVAPDQTATGALRSSANYIVTGTTKTMASAAADLKSLPAYIQTGHFVSAFTGLIKIDPTKTVDEINAAINDITDEQLKQAVQAMWLAARKDFAAFEAQIGDWFDSVMDRIGGYYKRYTQVLSFVFALAVAGAFNIDAVHITTALWNQASTLKDVDLSTITTNIPPQALLERLQETNLVGWAPSPAGPAPALDAKALLHGVLMALGWIAIAAGSLFGAPFWFDALQGLIQLRGTGPENKQPNKKNKQPKNKKDDGKP